VKLNGVSTLDDKSSYKMEGSHDGLCVNVLQMLARVSAMYSQRDGQCEPLNIIWSLEG
jgi:hypothetical protein